MKAGATPAWQLPGADSPLPSVLEPAAGDEAVRAEDSTWSWLDTFDWRLYRKGLRLREWRADGDTRRELATAAGEVVASGPGGGRFAPDLPAGGLRESLEPVIEMRALLPLVEVGLRRRVHPVRDERDKIVARVHVLAPSVRAPGAAQWQETPTRLEIEPLKGYDAAARALRTEAAADLEPAARSLYAEALAAIGRTPGDYSSKLDLRLRPKQPAASACRRIHRHLLATLEANEAGTRAATDSEFLHDFRVAIRRTRSALGQVKGVFPGEETRHFRAEFAWLQQATGTPRDLDVYLLNMPAYEASLPPEAGADLAPLRDFLERRRERAYGDLVRTLDADRYRRLLRDWRAFLDAGDAVGPQGRKPVRKVADRRIRKVHARLLREGRAIGPESPAEDLHELRKTCKKLRYLMEFFRSLYPAGDIGGLIKALKRLQENLGDFHDLHVQAQALGDFSREMATEGSAPPETLMAMGRLVEDLDGRALDARAEFAKRFERFASKKNNRLSRQLFGKA